MSPSRVEYDLGTNIHGQPLRLVRQRTAAGQVEWVLYREAANQRDDSVYIAGLTDSNLRYIARVLEAPKP